MNKTFIVSNPSQPVLKVACFVDEPYGSAVLTGFKPNERVLLARYGPKKLLDHDFVDMDENGTALITIPLEFTLIVSIGQDRPHEFEFNLSEDTSKLWMQVSAYDVLADRYCVTR